MIFSSHGINIVCNNDTLSLGQVKAYILAYPQSLRLCDAGHNNAKTRIAVDANAAFMHEF
jgi:hypothetical protein